LKKYEKSIIEETFERKSDEMKSKNSSQKMEKKNEISKIDCIFKNEKTK
jgi:hypothetical protein